MLMGLYNLRKGREGCKPIFFKVDNKFSKEFMRSWVTVDEK